MSNKKQTAVDWLIEKFSNYDLDMIALFKNEIQQAKELEKQDIEDAYRVGKVEASMFKEKHITGEQYYNETYRGDK
jgi:hypothetical protein